MNRLKMFRKKKQKVKKQKIKKRKWDEYEDVKEDKQRRRKLPKAEARHISGRGLIARLSNSSIVLAIRSRGKNNKRSNKVRRFMRDNRILISLFIVLVTVFAGGWLCAEGAYFEASTIMLLGFIQFLFNIIVSPREEK